MITTKALVEWFETVKPESTSFKWTYSPDVPNKPDRYAQVIKAPGRTEQEGFFDVVPFAVRFRGPFNHPEFAEEDAEEVRLLVERYRFPIDISGHGVQYIIQSGTPYGLPLGGQDRRQIVVANYRIYISTDI